MNQAIIHSGNDIFKKEYSSKTHNEFLKLLIESRNKVFHVDGSKHNRLEEIEYTADSMKFSILYKRILTKQILPDFKFNTDIQRYYIKLIDKWVDENSE